MLFNGSVRKNLDPFDEHDDVSVWNALTEVQLKNAVEELNGNILPPAIFLPPLPHSPPLMLIFYHLKS